jgi:hypothetical protein
LCYFQRGRGFFRRDTGESIEVTPGTAVHFTEDWRGALESSEPLEGQLYDVRRGPRYPHSCPARCSHRRASKRLGRYSHYDRGHFVHRGNPLEP